MNELSFFIEPGPQAVDHAAALIVKLLTDGPPGAPRPFALDVSPDPAGSQRLRIVAYYPDQASRLVRPKRPINTKTRRCFIPLARKN